MSRSSNSEPDLDDVADASAEGPSGETVAETAEAFGLGDVTWADDAKDAGVDARADEIPVQVPAGSEPPLDPDVGADQGVDENGTGDDSVAANARPIAVEDLVQDLERVAIERDQYLDASRRLQAEFENYRKVVAKREIEAQQRANESLVNDILPVLDACDAAVVTGAEDVVPVHATLVEALAKNGLERIDDVEGTFDPERHDAVMHDPAEGDGDGGPVVAEVMRAGYLWKGRVLRPAMVRVRG